MNQTPNTVTDKAVEAFREAWLQADREGKAGARVSAGLAAALPHLTTGKDVKAVVEAVVNEWDGFGHGEFNVHLEEHLPCEVCTLLARLRTTLAAV